MFCPHLRPGIEERNRLAGLGIFTRNMRPFVSVALRASQSCIVQIRLSTPRSGQDMADLKAADLELSGELTIFTAVTGAADDRFSELIGERIHASVNKPGSAVRRRAKATCASSFSIVRFCAKSTKASNSSCSA